MSIKSIRRQSVKKILLEVILWPLLGGVAIAFYFCSDCIPEGDYEGFIRSSLFSALSWTLLSNGNGLVVDFLDRHWSWIHDPIKRLVASIIGMSIFTIITSYLIVYSIVEWYFKGDFFVYLEQEGLYGSIEVSLIITLVLSLILHGRSFLLAWRRDAIEVEKLRNENLLAKFELLKNQVNPHFLFNSLNTLTSLVHYNQDGAVEFIQKLSEVYRYVLDHQYDELVSLKTELQLVESYVFLNTIRFGENLKVSFFDLDELVEDYQIPPLAVQMLVENCIKHNEISKDRVLNIEITLSEDFVQVKNNINSLAVPKRDSGKLGLGNIRSRYEFLTKRSVIIDHAEDLFSVQLPLLKTDQR